MADGLDANFYEWGESEWQTGLDSSPSPSDASSFYSVQSLEQSLVELREETYSPEYSLGDMYGYDVQTLSTLAIYGMCAGFAVSIGTALLAYAVSAVMRVFRGITTE